MVSCSLGGRPIPAVDQCSGRPPVAHLSRRPGVGVSAARAGSGEVRWCPPTDPPRDAQQPARRGSRRRVKVAERLFGASFHAIRPLSPGRFARPAHPSGDPRCSASLIQTSSSGALPKCLRIGRKRHGRRAYQAAVPEAGADLSGCRSVVRPIRTQRRFRRKDRSGRAPGLAYVGQVGCRAVTPPFDATDHCRGRFKPRVTGSRRRSSGSKKWRARGPR